MIVAITGGTGFIGRGLVVHHVAIGDEVRVFSRRPPCTGLPERVIWHQGDLSAGRDLSRFVEGADVLYHCAGELTDKSRMAAVHVTGTEALISAARGKIGRWVQLSSVGAYGHRSEGVVTEQTEVHPVGRYETTKTEADALVACAAGAGAFEFSVLRPSNVYGEGMSNRSLYQLFAMIQRGWFFFIGPPGASVNYVHVEDVVSALTLCATHSDARGKTYILSDSGTLEALVKSVATELARPMPSIRLPVAAMNGLANIFEWLPGFPLTRSRVSALTCRARYSRGAIEQDLGFSLQVPLCDGMSRLARHWQTTL